MCNKINCKCKVKGLDLWVGKTLNKLHMGIIGTAAGIGASIFGGISASKAMKKAKRNIEAQRKKNQDWYDQRYNEDATQRADAQRILTQTQEAIKDRNRAAAGAAAVMGSTDESIAAAKGANNAAIADAASRIASMADARKDDIEATYLANDNAFQSQLNDIEIGRANAIAGAVQGVAEATKGIEF